MDNPTPNYDTKLFKQIWGTTAEFKSDLAETPFSDCVKDATKDIMFYVISARYGNDPISNMDENQWKSRVFSTIFQFAPVWERRMEIQKRLRELTEEDLIRGGKAIQNHAYNPGTAPSTSALEELAAINDQNTTNYKKSEMDAYGQLWQMLSVDVTTAFLDRFQPLFKRFVMPEHPTLYVSDEGVLTL